MGFLAQPVLQTFAINIFRCVQAMDLQFARCRALL